MTVTEFRVKVYSRKVYFRYVVDTLPFLTTIQRQCDNYIVCWIRPAKSKLPDEASVRYA